ncbi:MAG: hypothetical protein LQ342_004653 [Letrouitia transgressa]|nr:MAG: hypothetical protein LQ342_004653 [Letrouitia transgressa]
MDFLQKVRAIPQYLLAQAAYSGSPTLFRLTILLPHATIYDHTVILNALDGGVPIWEILLEKDEGIKDLRLGHRGRVVELCARYDKPDVLKFLLQRGAEIDGEGMDLHMLARANILGEKMREVFNEWGIKVDERKDEGSQQDPRRET